ncbi:YgiW/YdeI family stress tolerance OB fold protein [Winslowiella iniecta]|uniref:Periplasmic protein n=2 Tax=Winslowiella iniecta TaxID=1560201 RepID=A0A0L7T562_9GAMM|nr:NirD/YgiW/YdeI family stress tolerance protein [Winslowiella iniecta]KOC90483.1 periplasmic protein [Winslowiella iniecta]KOC93638.1 periplasmic protein [Winslowiella iniecta]
MKITPIIALLTVFSFSTHAEEGGFKAGETAPPPHQQDAGYKGTEDTRENTINKVRDLNQDAWVTLEGNIIQHKQGESYLFRDKTDTIEIKVPQKVWKGKEFEADELVRISGRVQGKGESTVINVERLGEP